MGIAMYKQDPPFCVQVELSEGCNLYCDFCGLQGIREKPGNFKFMTLHTAKLLARQMSELGWRARVEFAMHGEPTMNPEYIEIVEVFRSFLPMSQLMMTSNGGGLLRPPGVVQSLYDLFDAGLNVFAFDAYEYVKIKDKVDEALGNSDHHGGALGFDVHRYPEQLEYSPHNRYGHTARKFIRVADISTQTKGTHSTLNNHCGNGSAPLKEALNARCAKPFRELSVRWNGDVALCCNDWRGVYKCGNVCKDGLDKVWHSQPFKSARKALLHGMRSELSPCDICDAKSYRVGLLPDKFGKETLPKPDPKDIAIMKAATKGKLLTTAVIRPWEITKRVSK